MFIYLNVTYCNTLRIATLKEEWFVSSSNNKAVSSLRKTNRIAPQKVSSSLLLSGLYVMGEDTNKDTT
nr:MAG TPA: hypothetical protein [Caudoviricetes sp.]